MQRFHFSRFADTARLADRKRAAGETLAVCIPTLDEAATIGAIVTTIRRELMEEIPLVDELVVVDSGSADATREIAAAAGATVHLASEIPPLEPRHRGKGENLWKALHVTTAGLVCYLDGDIANFHAGFVTGLAGPLLADPAIDYVKAYYERPLARGDGHHATGGGRVSEILIRPLVSMFYPELGGIVQPLSGEYAARRSVLETLSFPTGYGVEIAHLIDLATAGRLAGIAQTDLDKRIHRNRSDDELGAMAFALLRVVMRRLERDRKLTLAKPSPADYLSWVSHPDGPRPASRSIPEPERPPLRSPAYPG